MRKEKGTLLFLAAGGMEMSWLYAWANFLIVSILYRSFPFPEALTAFGLAALVTFISSGRGWRIIEIIGLHAFGLVFAASRIVYAFNSFPSPFWSKDWIVQFSNESRTPLEWFTLVLLLLWSIFFWIGGIALARRPMTYTKLCPRFDLGIGAFFLLFLVKLVPLVNEGIRLNDPASGILLFPFFIFGLLAIGMSRNRSNATKDFLPGYRSIGIILSFTITVLLFGTGLVLFFLPYLTLTAKAGYAILKIAGRPLVFVFLAIIRFMYGRGITRPEEPSAPASGSPDLSAPAGSIWWIDLLEKVAVWALVGIASLIAVVLLCLGLFYLFRWLFSRTSISRAKPGRMDLISGWVERLRAILLLLWKKIEQIMRGYRGATQLYTALIGWGRRSGLSHPSSETPWEYGRRLKHFFPGLNREIAQIIEAFHMEVYGGMTLRSDQLAETRSAWRRLRSPLHWPPRLRRRCGRQDAVPEQQSRPPRRPESQTRQLRPGL